MQPHRSESPSIYIGFSSLSAFDYCGLVGSAYANTTMAFDPTELSTLLFTAVVGTSTVVTVVTSGITSFSTQPAATLFSPDGSAVLNTKDLERNCSTISGYSYIPGNPSNAGFHITPRMFMLPGFSFLVFSFEDLDTTWRHLY